MYTNKSGVVTYLNEDEVAFFNEYVVTCLDEGVMAFLDNNDKDYFDVVFILAHLLE